MRFISAEKYGIVPSNKKGIAEKLSELFRDVSQDCTIVLNSGRYYLENSVRLANLSRVSIEAYGATFVTKFDPSLKDAACKGGFVFENCEDLSIYGMKFDNDNPVNIVGRIIAIDFENNTFDVRLEDGFSIRGDEHFLCLDTCDEDRSPNFHIFFCDFNGYKYEKLDTNTLRFYIWHTIAHHLKSASVGEKILLKHSLYSGAPMNFKECRRVLIEDITVLSTPGICCGIYPRSEDFTFRRFNVHLPYGSKQICSSQTDGIHIKGLVGKLVMEDCHFTDMGDDALNIHNKAGTIYEIDGNGIKMGIRTPKNSLDEKPPELLPESWAQKGDVIYAYDEKTLEKKGELTVTDFGIKDGFNYLNFENFTCELWRGMKLANSAYYAQVEIKNCSVTGSRARGFLIQSQNVNVENCRFERTSSAGVLLACDIDYWNEMGPVNNVVIKNNVFDNCGKNYNDLCAGGVVVDVNHSCRSAKKSDKQNVHHNIAISGNKFVNMKDSAIFANAVTGLTITENDFGKCASNKQEKLEDYRYDVVLFNCENVIIENNNDLYGKNISINDKQFV